jgi:hypothetical protein
MSRDTILQWDRFARTVRARLEIEMARNLPPSALPFDLQAAVDAARMRRAACAARDHGQVTEIGRKVDQLGELHADLEDDDALHQALNALTFVWQYVEQELVIVGSGKN